MGRVGGAFCGVLLACLLTILAVGSTASAAKGVYDTFGAVGTEGGQFAASTNGIAHVAVNSHGTGGANAGDVYVVDRGNNRIQRFGADGTFIVAWGLDVEAGGGTGYEICALKASCKAGLTGAAAGANGGMSDPRGIAVGQATGSVYVGDRLNRRVDKFSATGAFILSFGQDVVASGPGNTGGFEVCVAANGDVCKAGVDGTTGGAFESSGGGIGSVVVAPAGAINAGNVLVADAQNRRVQEFTASGVFVRAFGWNVVSSGSGNTGTEFEVCNASVLDVCRSGEDGSGVGQFRQGPQRIAEDSSGNVYTVESRENGNFRVQRFTLPGNVVSPQGAFDPGELSGTGPVTGGGATGDTPIDIAVDTSSPPGTPGTVFVLKYFPAGAGSPPVPLPASNREARILEVDPSANGGTGGITDSFAALAKIGSGDGIATGLALNTTSERLYVSQPPSPVYVIDEVPAIGVSDVRATDIGSSTATLRATIAPSPLPHLHTLYSFEYARLGSGGWNRAEALDADVGNGSSPVSVAQEIAGLDFEASYEFKLVAHTEFNGAQATVAGAPFRTQPTPPVATTGAAAWSSPAASGPSLLFGGTVNPGHDRTTYYFQYVSETAFLADTAGGGSGFEHASSVPSLPAEAGEGVDDVSVHQSVSGLDPTKVYRYRLVATNSVDTALGATTAVLAPSDGDRFYELVSNGDSWGNGIIGNLGGVAADGGRAAFSAQAFGQSESLPGPSNPYVSNRTASGWQVASMFPEVERTSEQPLAGGGSQMASDLGATLWAESSYAERERGEMRFGLVRLDGTRSVASAHLVPLAATGSVNSYAVLGASKDLSVAAFKPFPGGISLFPGEPLLGDARHNLYSVSGGAIGIVNRANGKEGAIIGGVCGADLGANLSPSANATVSHAVSDDGSVLYFSARPTAPTDGACGSQATEKAFPKRLYKRVNGETTVQVSASQCTRVSPPCLGGGDAGSGEDEFQSASADGSVAFFTSTRQLTDSDEDATSDLYVYDASPPAGQPTLVQASAGEAITGHPAVGSGAKVLGMLDGSADGSRVYFVAESRLTADASAVAGARNLYVYERDDSHPGGRIAFVGSLAGGDSPQWTLEGGGGGKSSFALPLDDGKGNGHLLLFLSAAALTAGDGDASRDLYRYDDTALAGERLSCLSCAGDEPIAVETTTRAIERSPADYAERAAVASADVSTVVFTTREALTADDHNGAIDVYIWRDGALSLVSGETEGFGVAGGDRASAVSPDGRNVFFITRAPLVASDSNNSLDLYDARVGGGFPASSTQTLCASNEACQGTGQSPPPQGSPASSTFAGPGNRSPSKACKKNQVRKQGKCVRKPVRHKKHRAKRASRKHGGER